MSYYKALGLQKEPFSTSPDPDFFYHSRRHSEAVKRLEIAIHLRRGLNIILGDVGTGKTMVLRALLKTFKDEEDFIFHLILDPGHKSESQFLLNLVEIFDIEPAKHTVLGFKEALERYLFQKGAQEKKTVILLIDEGQKMIPENLEALRAFLNYETNEYKLLQLVIMAQTELMERLRPMRNFMDRVSFKYTIDPLDEWETKQLIEFRLKVAGCAAEGRLFTDEAVESIYQYTRGYPRKITMLCHNALEELVMRERGIVTREIIEELREAKDGR